MEHISLIKYVAKRPGMYFVDETFSNFIAFVSGYNLALEGKLLRGFNEWLWEREIIVRPLSWIAIVHYSAYESEIEKMEYFICLLEEFISEK